MSVTKKRKAKKQATRVIPHVVTGNYLEAKELAAAFSALAKYPLRATAVLTGYPRIRPYDPIIVKGVPNPDLWGVWVVLEVKHLFSRDGAAAYQLEVVLGTNRKLLNSNVLVEDGLSDASPGLEEEIDLSEDAYVDVLDEEIAFLEVSPDVFTVLQETTSLEETLSKVYSQDVGPLDANPMELWWNPSTSELNVSFAGSWVEVGTGLGLQPGMATETAQLVVDLETGELYVDVLSSLRVAVQSDVQPFVGQKIGSAELILANDAWYSLDKSTGAWTMVESPPVHFDVAAATLRAIQNARATGWIITPRGLESTEAILNDGLYSDEAPDFAGGEPAPYWIAEEY